MNNIPNTPVRSLGEIVKANVFTPVNAIISTLFVLILVAGFPADALFAGVVVSNSVIGVVQELRARRTLHQLELLNAPTATARRDGDDVELAVNEVVANDVLELDEARTAATVTLFAAGLVVLVLVSRPMQVWKVGLAVAMAVLFVPFLRDYFELDLPHTAGWVTIAVGSLVAALGVWLAPAALDRFVGDD